MKNAKRIFAILGVIILFGLYAATLVFALIDSPFTLKALKVSVGLTVIIPVLLWIYMWLFRQMEQRRKSMQNDLDAQIHAKEKEDF